MKYSDNDRLIKILEKGKGYIVNPVNRTLRSGYKTGDKFPC